MTSQIPLFKVFMNPKIDITPTLTSGFITQGSQVENFEQQLSDWFQYKYILTVNSATSGLTLVLRLLNLPSGSEILTTPLTCLATNFPILATGHKIKWVDVDDSTCNISLDDLKNKINSNTGAIMIVHWGGYPIDMNKLKKIQQDAEHLYNKKIPIIEDCAHAFGAKYNEKFVGTTGNIAVFSLQAIKHLTTGDGGLIFLPTQELYDRAKLLRWYGISREQRSGNKDFRLESDVKEWGYKFHMNDINAAIGISNLPFIKKNLEITRNNALYYRNELKDIEGIELFEENKAHESSYWIFTIKIINKERFIDYMKSQGITVSQVHNRNDIHSCLKEYQSALPRLDELEKKIISIPVGWWISTDDRKLIVSLIKQWCRKHTLKYNIRELKVSDRIEYLNLLKQMNNYSIEYTDNQFSKRLVDIASQNSTILVIEHVGHLIGSGKLFIENKFYQSQAHIEDIVVDKDYRRLGLATKIIENLIELSKTNNCYKISLCANQRLSGLYESCKFKNMGNHYALYLTQ
jgi:dTDP-4-amino-4,6-dideoxygalactose transaminase/ribosomal protein S18 acetylase RimI-like enzyme